MTFYNTSAKRNFYYISVPKNLIIFSTCFEMSVFVSPP